MIVLTAVVFSGITLLYKEWRSGYVIWNQPTYYKINLLTFEIKKILEGLYRPIFATKELGIPEVRLYISQQSQNALMRNLPGNIKTWQEALLAYPNGKLTPVKARHRGDNPVNWAYGKKSWRIKTRKKNLINRKRVFNYIVPQEGDFLANHIAYTLGRWSKVLSPESRMVEVYINDKSFGIYAEVEHLDESFLRNNDIMPVNLYKGEQSGIERQFLVDTDLFSNPNVWSKVATFNQSSKEDFSDLHYFLELVRKSETSEEAFSQLKRVARFKDWAKFSAYQTLVQSWHNNGKGNARFVSDPWRGTIQPIVLDTSAEFDPINYRPRLEEAPHSLLWIYHASSEFIVEKYRYLYQFVQDEILLRMASQIKQLMPDLGKTYSRDQFRLEKLFVNEHLARPAYFQQTSKLIFDEEMNAEWNRSIKNLSHFQEYLINQLEQNPKGHWFEENGGISLIVDGYIPIGQVVFKIAERASTLNSIVWDRDGDGKISKQDTPIPFKVNKNNIALDATWVANRVVKSKQLEKRVFPHGKLVATPTQFNLLLDPPISPVSAIAQNILTGKSHEISNIKSLGNSPRYGNQPIVSESVFPTKVWSAEVEIKRTQIIKHPVKILPGTTIYMHPGSSLIFRNKVRIEGTQNAPVRILSAKQDQIWGVMALHGMQTQGSIISHLEIENGSGSKVNNVNYVGMFSIHETKNVQLNHLVLRNNHKFDDMMHVVYSEGIELKNCQFENAFADALDVDISSIHISQCSISNAANDAIDLMGTRALIENSDLLESGDKGVSVGEASEATIINSVFHKNVIGVEAKDGSNVYLINVDMIKNNRQLNAYSKNWRYEIGGTILVSKSFFKASKNKMAAKKGSRITIFDSSFPSGFPKENKNIFMDKLSNTTGDRVAASKNYNKLTRKILSKWNIESRSMQRGMDK